MFARQPSRDSSSSGVQSEPLFFSKSRTDERTFSLSLVSLSLARLSSCLVNKRVRVEIPNTVYICWKKKESKMKERKKKREREKREIEGFVCFEGAELR